VFKKGIKSPDINVKKDKAILPIGSPEQRSFARKMGSSHSLKTPPKKIRKRMYVK
jgi:hypothetical protein